MKQLIDGILFWLWLELLQQQKQAASQYVSRQHAQECRTFRSTVGTCWMVYGKPVGYSKLRHEGDREAKPKIQRSPHAWLHSQARNQSGDVHDKQRPRPFFRNAMIAECDNHQQQSPTQTDEVGAQIHLGNEVLRRPSLRIMGPRFLNVEPQFISLPRRAISASSATAASGSRSRRSATMCRSSASVRLAYRAGKLVSKDSPAS